MNRKLSIVLVLLYFAALQTGSSIVSKTKLGFNENARFSGLFTYNREAENLPELVQYLNSGSVITINSSMLKELNSSKPAILSLTIPVNSFESIQLELEQGKVLSDDFECAELSSNGSKKIVPYEPGNYYRGFINGQGSQWAAISIFKDYVVGIIASGKGNYNLVPLKNNDGSYGNEYVIYNDIHLKYKNNFSCAADEIADKNPVVNIDPLNMTQSMHTYPVKKYFECDYAMYQKLGSNTTNVNNFITAAYNAVIAIYQAEQIVTNVSSTYIWVTPDIYTNTTDVFVMLKRLGGRIKNTYNGHCGHLLSTRTNTGGGIAWIDMLCWPYYSGDSSGPYAVSIIDTSIRNFPVYSYTVYNITHETGHTIGSHHTHSCLWPGGPIDTCYQPEGGCYTGPIKPRVGTIMSYCFANGSVNFSLGFGTLPGNQVRARYNAAPCLIGITQLGTEIPQMFLLEQNYPNPFNPSTNIKFSVPPNNERASTVKIIVYDVSGKEIARLVEQELQPGNYSVDFDASGLPSGVYFYKMISGNFSYSRKMILIK